MSLKQDEIRFHLASLRQRLAGPGFFNAAYALLMLLILAVIALSAARFLAFSMRLQNQVTEASAADLGSETRGFDIPMLILLAPRLGLAIPDLAPAKVESEPPPPAPPPAAPAVEVPAEAAPPPPVELDISILRISILNGTEVAGLAKQWKEKFFQAGFVEIGMGNAETKNHQEFSISHQPPKKEYLERVRQVITGNGGRIGAETEDPFLSEDFVIIIGVK